MGDVGKRANTVLGYRRQGSSALSEGQGRTYEKTISCYRSNVSKSFFLFFLEDFAMFV